MSTLEATNVVITVTVDAPVEHCFDVFTAQFASWWPASHHISEVEMASCHIEPRVGGRWYEVGVDGSECDWGTVLAWDPPRLVSLAWHLNGEFKYVADPERASRVHVRFTDLGDGTTRVELDHADLDRHGEGWEQLRNGVGGQGGWRDILQEFVTAAAA